MKNVEKINLTILFNNHTTSINSANAIKIDYKVSTASQPCIKEQSSH